MINICFPFIGDSFGGSHKSMLLLIKNLNKTKYKTEIVLHRKGILSNYLDKNKILYEFLDIQNMAGENPNSILTIIHMLKNYYKIKKFIQERSIDIVHTNDLRCNLSWALPSKINAYHIWHQRTIISNSFVWKYINRITNRIICISKTVRKKINGYSDLVYNPFIEVDLNKIKSQNNLRSELKFNDKPIVGYVGRLEKDKGVETLFEISKKMKNINFVIYGEGKMPESIPKNLKINKFTSNIESKIEGFDILISPSLKEGFGRTLVEAILVKTPVIASNIDAHKEISTKENFISLVEVNNVHQFKDRINSVLKNHSQLVDLEKARNHALKKYNITQHVRAIENIYNQINV